MKKNQLEAKNFMMSACHVDARINSRLEQIASLRDLAEKATAVLSDMPGGDKHGASRLEEVVIRIVDLEDELKVDIMHLAEAKKDILCSIRQVHNPEYRTLLELRYLSGMGWGKIADELGYGVDNIYRMHRKALEELKIPEEFRNADETLQ